MIPENITTLIEMLAWRAEVSATKIAFTFDKIPYTFKDLWGGINDFAIVLQNLGLRAYECVVIVLPNSAEFFFAFYGVQRAGGIAVPIFPGSGIERIFAIAGSCNARFIVAPPNILAEGIDPLREAGTSGGLSVFKIKNNIGEGKEVDLPTIQSDDVAFLQYTSGSTGNPKGVMLTHANLLTNIRQMIAGMEITEHDIFVSWLPVYHDMGLILKTMVPFYLAAETHLLPTNLRDVHLWLETIQLCKGTFTAAPDFAYRLMLNRIGQNEYDLSSLRVALNAAEPVRATTIHEFERRFGLKNVMTAGYGLAEATVGVSMSQPGQNPKVDKHGIVSVGKPFPDVEVKIMDNGETLKVGQVGEILIKSTANCKGYYNNPEETKNLFRDGFIISGDMGNLDEDGNLYITGRKKNMIKHLGQTIAGQELEEIVDTMPGVRFSAAVGIDRGRLEGEQVYLFAEMRNQGSTEIWEELTLRIVEAIHARLGIRPARVVFLKRHGIPRTHNGKIQHVLLKEQFLSGKLKEDALMLYPDF
jgi:acyl-CoA synthetase (AMP-forming)/AMP-acid ligase II